MKHQSDIELYFAPRTRSLTALWCLEELKVDYELKALQLAKGEHRTRKHYTLNPMGKVPALRDGDVQVSETGAICLYLADRYRESIQLSPDLNDSQRGDFLRWCFFAGSVVEPCIAEKLFSWDIPDTTIAWGSTERMAKAITHTLQSSTWLLGEEFTCADLLVGSSLRFGVLFGAFKGIEAIENYVNQLEKREALQRALTIESSCLLEA